MRMVIQIAKAELRNLFYSPVAWFLTIIFLVLFAYAFTPYLVLITRAQEAQFEINPDFKNWGIAPLTSAFFNPPNGILRLVLENLYLFVPLLTMGLIGRETQLGTIRLLYSSPVKIRQIVGGKFLAIMAYNMVLVVIAAMFMITFSFCVRSVDYGIFFTSVLALFLLACAYTSVGLFVSSLTSYQIVAAIGTFLIVFVLSRIGGLWQKYDVLRDLTYFLHLEGRTVRMMRGLIATKDIVYYVMIVFMFLGFTLIRLKGQRESKPWFVKLTRVVIVIGITLTVGYFFSLPKTTLYKDVTAMQVNTIHPNTQKVLEGLKDGPMEVTLFVNLLGGSAFYGFPETRNSYLTYVWEKILRFKTDINFKYVYYYFYDPGMDNGSLQEKFPGKNNEEMARELAKGFGVNFNKFMTYEELNKGVNVDAENHRLLMQLSYKGRTEYLRTYLGSGLESVFPNEDNMAAALKRLAYPETIPAILYTSDNLERKISLAGEREYYFSASKQLSESIVNLGFNADSISLEKQEIPANITALVVADPKTPFSETAYRKIKKYMDDGGNIIFMGEPGKQQILNPIVSQLGVALMDGNLVEPTFHEKPDMVKPYYSRTSPDLARELMLWHVREKWKLTYFKDTFTLLMPGVTALSVSDSNGFTSKPVMLTSGTRSWLKKGKLVVDSAEVIYNPQDGDLKGAFPTVLQLTRQVGNKQQRAAIFGDADFMSNRRWKDGSALNRAVLSWMSGNEYPVYTTILDEPKDNLMTISSGTAKVIKIIYLWMLPSILLIAAIVLLVRRKRK